MYMIISYRMHPILMAKVNRDVESGEISNSLDSEDLLETPGSSITHIRYFFHAGNNSLAYALQQRISKI